ncbi:twin transmembrane helix small protein [Alcanivorax quisquiliarum]|uniref:Twin transmembrane helix small protein n=1 Tax=Alcanivorax quisquiliarum TaxID=2933565 RepID=A0ABT0E6F4_9GAMM|nr:twin transmembrane helix small protein [Alcanivorax quisquiliarum]MCK0537254.1 twin transmembrane helix small protein [Alcanivorax quisquiliarum]
MWWVKLVVLLLLAAVAISLFRGLSAVVRNKGKEGATVRALTWRVAFSVAVVVVLFLSMWMGWLQPHDVNPTTRGGVPIERQAPASQPAP